jgi:hypothetical protein
MPEFECTMAAIHNNSPWMLREEEWLSGDLVGCSSWQQSNGCGQVARGGSGDALSSDESEFFHRRNPKEGKE